MSTIGRRVFVKRSALAFLALGIPPEFLARPLLAGATGADRKKTLICIFQRGAVDGLSMVVPFGEHAYYDGRRSIAIDAPGVGREAGAIDLDGFFGLHPSLDPLVPLFQRQEMAIVQAVGSPHPTRSHFDAQDFMETGTPGVKATTDGWLNRILDSTGCAGCSGSAPDGRTLADPNLHAADHASGQAGMATAAEVAALRGIAMSSALPKSLQGSHPTLAIEDLAEFGVSGSTASPSALERLYQNEDGDRISAAAGDAFEAMRILKSVRPDQYAPASGVEYPNGEFGRSLRQIAQLIKADVGLEIGFADIGGWDTHVGQGGANGQLARNLDQLASGIRALYDDLGDRMEDVLILTMSEFGRTVNENGSGGTDHGHANCMFALGGGVAGGQILGDWPGLDRDQLYEGRDLDVTTDFRDIFAEVAGSHLGADQMERIFPGYDVDPARFRGVLK